MAKMGLSKNLLKMKFMQRRSKEEEKHTKGEGNEDRRTLNIDGSEFMSNTGSRFTIEPSFVRCEDLVFGRMSFRGQNPEIEKIMKQIDLETQQQIIDEKEQSGTISAEEMAYRYSTLIGSISKKFSTKRQRQQAKNEPSLEPSLNPQFKRKKFMKPEN